MIETDKEIVYIGIPTELLSNIITTRGKSEEALQENDYLSIQAIDVRGDLSIILCEKSKRNLQ